jgi:peptide/nickel transport system substrate-binding protein
MSRKKVSRREFIKISALTAAGLAATACGQQPDMTATPEEEEATAVPPTEVPAEETEEAASQYSESPMFSDLVDSGELPSVDERLPLSPLVLELVEQVGEYGGTWRRIDSGDGMGWFKQVYATENFAKWTRDVKGIRPNVFESWEWNDDATELTAYLRRGIKWSDGTPLTIDDYVFYWEDMVLNEDISFVTPSETRVEGEPMGLEKVDDFTAKFTFAASHPLFLDLCARGFYHSASHLVPSEYMKQFHPDYGEGVEDDTDLVDHYNNRQQYPDMPTLNAWRTVEFSSGERARFERNPYYWKVDPEGNQLPYIDVVESEIAEDNAGELIVLKASAGELDCQVRDVSIRDVPVVMEGTEDGGYRVIMWDRGDYAWPWLMLFYDYEPDPAMEDLMYEQKWRQALSHAINRERINEVVALNLATPRQAALSAESPEFQTPEGREVYEEWANVAVAYDPDRAASLLDEIGVVDDDGDGFREKPDGSPLNLIVSVGSGDTKSIDSMDLVKEDWEAVGLKTTIDPLEGSVLGQRTEAGEVMIRAWGSAAAWGLISAAPVWAPVEGVGYCVGGQRIGQYFQTNGEEGVAPRPGSALEQLQNLYAEVIQIVDREERQAKLLDAYRVHIDEGPITLGTVGEHPSPVIVKNNFRNVQEMGLVAAWDLAYPGTADPEQFFIEQG